MPDRRLLAPLSDWLSVFQAVFRAHGHDCVYLVGSGARALLDGRYESLRDVDLFLDGEARSTVDPYAELATMTAALGDTGAIRAQPGAPREKRRADPEHPLSARDRHTIGAGLHVFPRERGLPIVSLTLLTRRRGLALNGIFDIDTLYVVLDTRRPLMAQIAAPVVVDPFAGYRAWQARSPRVVHWEEVARCHGRNGLRIARTLAECGRRELDAELIATYRACRPARSEDTADEVFRELLKLLAGPAWCASLSLAGRLGVFADEPAFAWLARALAAWDDAGERAGESTALERARRWLSGLGAEADEPLARLAAVVPSVFAFP